jgi:anti-sigma factor RsiW
VKSRIGKTVTSGGEEFLTCEEIVTFLIDYLSRDLTQDEELEFERHLSICPSCVSYVRTYRQAVRLGRVAMREGANQKPPELAAELVRAILDARR